MRKFLFPALFLTSLALACVAGGCESPNCQTFDALNESWGLLRPYALTGIAVDGTLDPASREIRNRQVDEFTKLIEEGLANAE